LTQFGKEGRKGVKEVKSPPLSTPLPPHTTVTITANQERISARKLGLHQQVEYPYWLNI
jgi:hypothetical protein